MSATLKHPALLTDLYQLTMLGGHFALGRKSRRAVFEYFFRKLPPHAGYAIFAGLEDLLAALEHLRFHDDELDYLRSLGLFPPEFLAFLKDFRFHGDVWAAPEGSAVFPYVPLVRVDAALPEAQLVETLLLNVLNYQTLIATKAARLVEAAEGEPVIEFGLRRAQGPDGGLCGSRAAFIGGCESTSNVAAGMRWGIPVRGTHAHAWVMSFPSEREAFRAYAKVYPRAPLLLVDTYDTLRSGLPNAIAVFKDMRAAGWEGRAAIRLDSGDLARLSIEAHRMLEAAGFPDPLIVASNDLDEELVADLKRQGAKINCWGIGTKLITGGDTPALGGVYKLAAFETEAGAMRDAMKLSGNPEKTTDPGIKVPLRFLDAQGRLAGDVLFTANESLPESAARVLSPDRQFSGRKLAFAGGRRGNRC
ncbi:MAG: nicotinate phosphoribosyltransferase [Planctomycetota bacterium]|nr:nicotinate phosphoribosyltransferase [Planctomycetota bacterium]